MDIKPAIFAVLDQGGEIVGTGFLVAPNLAVTCAHVIFDVGANIGDVIHIRFHDYKTKSSAVVIAGLWRDVDQGDIAFLRLNSIIKDVLPLRLAPAADSRSGNSFISFGYATAADVKGIAVRGTIDDYLPEHKLLQIQAPQANHGISGAPVIDEKRGVVVGMITKGHNELGRNELTTFATPAEILWEVCPDIKPSIPPLPRHNPIVDGVNLLPYDYDQRIQNFLTEYLGTDTHPVPFGGRDDALQMLDAWLADTTPYLLLAAPAGRGKSALLVHWLDSLKEYKNLALAFVPISIRFGSNMERVFYAALAARLAFLHGDDIPNSPETFTAVYRGLVSDYLSKPLADGRTLLVVLDGLDEAADWQAGVDFMPAELPAGVRVVVSARFLAGDADSLPWLRRLNWERNGLASAPFLAPLSQDGVRDVLFKMGCPLDELSRNVDIVAKLYGLSIGDPLLVGLYVGDLWTKGNEITRLKPEDLADIQPGYKGYFDRWWEDQKKLWNKDKPWLAKHVRTVRNLLARALGPLFRDDFQALVPELESDYISDALDALQRFIIGNNQTQGYTFSHPRLGQYFWEVLTPTEQTQVEEHFLNWCEGTFQEFINGKRDPKKKSETPVYVVHNYGAHLKQTKQPIERWLPLIHHQQWAHAWFTVEDAYGGYCQDIKHVWEQCKISDQQDIKNDGKQLHLDQQIRCALIETSLHSMAGNVPNELIVTCLKLGVRTSSESISIAKQKSDLGEGAICLALISDYLADPDKKIILTIALENMATVENNYMNFDSILEEIVKHIPYEFQDLLIQSLVLAQKIKYLRFRVRVLCLLAEKISQQTDEILAEAITISHAIENQHERTLALAMVARTIPIAASDLIDNFINSIRPIEDENDHIEILLAIFHSSSRISYNLLNRILDELKLVGNYSTYNYSQLIRSIADRLSDEDQDIWGKFIQISQYSNVFTYTLKQMPRQFRGLWVDALSIVRDMDDNYKIERAMELIVPNLPADDRDLWRDLILNILMIEDESHRLSLFKILIKNLPAEMMELWNNAFSTAEQFADSWAYANALVAIIEFLPPEFHDLWGKLLDLGCSSKIQNYSYSVLRALAEHLPLSYPHYLEDFLNYINSHEEKAVLLAAVAHRFPSHKKKIQTIDEALQIARKVELNFSRTHQLASLLKYLPPTKQSSLLAEIVPVIGEIDEFWRADLLEAVLGYLLPEMTDEWNMAVSAVSSTNNEMYRKASLRVLIKNLPSAQDHLALRVLNLFEGMKIMPEADRAMLLREFIERFSMNSPLLSRRMLDIANTIDEENSYLDVLGVLISHAPNDTELWHQFVMALESLAEKKKTDSRHFFDALASVSEHLPTSLTEIWMRVWNLTSQLDDSYQVRFLSNIVEKLANKPDHLWIRIFEKALKIEYSRDRSLILHEIANKLPSKLNYLYRNAIEESYEVNDTNIRAETLLSIANYLSREDAHFVVSKLVDSLNKITDGKIHLAVIKSAIKNLSVDRPKYTCEDLLIATRLLDDEVYLVDALLVIIPHLSESIRYSVLKEVLEYSRAIKYEDSRVKAMLSILVHFSGDKQKNLLLETIRIARTEQYPDIKVLLIIKIVETLNLLNRSFWKLTFEQILRALGNKNEIPSRRSLLADAITVLPTIEDDTSFNIQLAALCKCLSSTAPSLLTTVVKVIQESVSKKRRAYGIAIVAVYLPVDQQSTTLNEALNIARTIEDGTERAYVLRTIASNLPFTQRHEVLTEALGLARHIQDDGMRVATLQTVIRQVSPEDQELFLMGLDMARKIEPKHYRVEALATVAKNLPLDQRINVLDEALFISQTIQDGWKAKAILEVAKALPNTTTGPQQKMFRAICNYALNNNVDSFNERTIIDILETITPCWVGMFESDFKAASSTFSEVLNAFSNKKRSSLLEFLTAFAPVIYQLGREKAVLASAQSILDTSEWWA